MAFILYETCEQYPLGKTVFGVNEYEFVADSQTPSQISWPRASTAPNYQFQTSNISPPTTLSSSDPAWFDDAIKIVNTPTPREGTKCFRHYMPANEPKIYVGGRTRSQLMRSSQAGAFAEQTWFKKRFYAVSFYFPVGFPFNLLEASASRFGFFSLHSALTPPGFTGAIPLSIRANNTPEFILRNENGYSTSGINIGTGVTITTGQWMDFLIEVMWDPFNAGDPEAPPGKGGTGYIKVYIDQVLRYSSGTKAQGMKQDYNAGNLPPFWLCGPGCTSSQSNNFWPIEMFTDRIIIGDESETVASMNAGLSPVLSKLATLGFSPVAGSYLAPQTITLTGINDVEGEGPTTGAAAFYSINSGAYQAYSGSISLPNPGSHTLDAYQEKSGFEPSTVASGSYTLNASQLSVPFRIECGKSSGTIPAGWTLDAYYSGTGLTETSVSTTILSIPSGYTESIFQSIRGSWGVNGALKYDIPAPNGSFECRLLLCELNATNDRHYKVKLQGEGTAGAWKKLDTEDEYTVLSPLTIVGRYTALVVFRIVTISDGFLHLEWEYDDDTGGLTVVGIELLNIPAPNDQVANLVLL